jgi:hypothetical protein
MQTAVDTIRNGSLLSSSQLTEATGNNSDALPQVETSFSAPRIRVNRTPEEEILWNEKTARRTIAYQAKLDAMDAGSMPPKSQEQRTKQIANAEKDLAVGKRFREQRLVRSSVPPGNDEIGQRVLG